MSCCPPPLLKGIRMKDLCFARIEDFFSQLDNLASVCWISCAGDFVGDRADRVGRRHHDPGRRRAEVRGQKNPGRGSGQHQL